MSQSVSSTSYQVYECFQVSDLGFLSVSAIYLKALLLRGSNCALVRPLEEHTKLQVSIFQSTTDRSKELHLSPGLKFKQEVTLNMPGSLRTNEMDLRWN